MPDHKKKVKILRHLSSRVKGLKNKILNQYIFADIGRKRELCVEITERQGH